MSDLAPFEVLHDAATGDDQPLPARLLALYGPLRFPLEDGRPHVIANFVATLDGVVSLGLPGMAGGGEISGFNQHDRLLMAILRAVSDAIVVGAGTQRAAPPHLWTAEYVFPALAETFGALRAALGKREPPLTVVVTASGEVDLELPVFRSGQTRCLILTTDGGLARLADRLLPTWVSVRSAGSERRVSARRILEAVSAVQPCRVILTEGGPRLLADFFAEACLDELFLTIAPQVAGRDAATERPGLVMGRSFAPSRPIWGRVVSLRRAGDHLFVRYAFDSNRRA